MRVYFKFVLPGAVWCMAALTALAQPAVIHQLQEPVVSGERVQLDFMIPGLTAAEVAEAFLFYRYDNNPVFAQKELFYKNGGFTADIPIDTLAAEFEYYLAVHLIGNEKIMYPRNFTAEGPVIRPVVRRSTPKRQLAGQLGIDFTVLSPAPGSAVIGDRALIAMALFYDTGQTEPGEFRLYLDEEDVSGQAQMDPFYIAHKPAGLAPGAHKIRVEYNTESTSYLVHEWEFTVLSEDTGRFPAAAEARVSPVTGNFELAARNQEIGGDVNNAYTGRAVISGRNGEFRYNLNAFFTTQETFRQQPQNRFGLNLQYGRWWELQAGHIYPALSRFTINGNRIYGVNTAFHLADEAVNLQLVYGELSRKITNQYEEIVREELILGNQVADTTYSLKYKPDGRGTFRRTVAGGRLAFGRLSNFQFGIQALRVQDDTTSIYNARSFTDIFNQRPELYQNLSPQDMDKLSSNPEILNTGGGALAAKGNLMLGMDAAAGFARNRVRINTEGAFSLLNNDIYGGALTAEKADEMGFELPGADGMLLDRISKIIVINENMDVLPVRFSDFGTDSASASFFFPKGLFASQTDLTANFPANYFKLQYRWVGPDYNSLANSTIRKDIAGFTLSDRFGLFRNRLYITLGFEKLRDNLIGRKEATTHTFSYKTNIGWYPVSGKLPRLNAGISIRNRDNGIARFNPFLPDELQKQSLQNFIVSGSDTLAAAAPRAGKTINLNGTITQLVRWLDRAHDVSLNYSAMKTTDHVFYFGDINSQSLSIDILTRLDRNFDVRTGFSVNNTRTGRGLSDIRITGLYTGLNYYIPGSTLNINGSFTLTNSVNTIRNLIINNTTGNEQHYKTGYYELSDTAQVRRFKTVVLQAGLLYNLSRHHSLSGNIQLTNNLSSQLTGDRLAQLTYMLRF